MIHPEPPESDITYRSMTVAVMKGVDDVCTGVHALHAKQIDDSQERTIREQCKFDSPQ